MEQDRALERSENVETTLKAIAIQTYGGPEGLAVVDLPVPAPAVGQVLIATEAVGVGGVDTVIRSGALAAYGFKEGHIPGGEVAGTVTAVGDGVDASWIGRMGVGLHRHRRRLRRTGRRAG